MLLMGHPPPPGSPPDIHSLPNWTEGQRLLPQGPARPYQSQISLVTSPSLKHLYALPAAALFRATQSAPLVEKSSWWQNLEWGRDSVVAGLGLLPPVEATVGT